MLNQRQISLEQDSKQKCLQNYKACHKEFLAKTDVALGRFRQRREALEHEKQDLENELKKVVELRKGVERALEEMAANRDDALSNLECVERENQAMVQQIVPLTRALQDAKDAREEELMLKRQWV
jgi:hypothetical protein